MTINRGSERRPTAKCSSQSPLQDAEGIRVVARQMLRTHVFRRSTEVNPLRSTRQRRSLGGTMWRFHLGGSYIQCCSFSTDPEGRANFWSPSASGRLKLVLALPVNNGSVIHNERLILFISLAICCMASIVVVSLYNTLCERGKSTPRALKMPCIDNFPSSTQTITLQMLASKKSNKLYVPFMTTFTLFTSPWTTSRVCATVIRPSSWVRRSSLCSTASISLSPSSFFANFSISC